MAAQDIEINVVTNGVDSLKDVSLALRAIVLAAQDNVRVIGHLDARQKGLNQALGITNKGFEEHAKKITQAARNQGTLRKNIAETTADLKRLRTELALGRGGPGMPGLVRDLENAQKAMSRMKPRALVSDLRGISTELKRVGKDAQFVGRSLIIGLTTPIIGFASKGIAAMVALERQIVQTRKIIGQQASENEIGAKAADNLKKLGHEVEATTPTLVAINNVLRDTSLTLGISRDALTGITADFAQLGVEAGDTLAILTKTAGEVSILGNIDLDASQELTQTLFLGMQRALDKRGELFTSAAKKQAKATQLLRSQIFLFNAVENATAMSFRDISESLPEISAAVTEFGLSFMEGLALVAPIKAAGIQTSVAANAIKMSLQRLTAPTITARKHMAALEGQMLSQVTATGDLANAFDNLFSVGTVGLQALIDITNEVQKMKNGGAEASAMFSKLFDKRQSTRMKIAVDDMAAFQRQMNLSNTGAGRLISMVNGFAEEARKATGATLPLINNVETLSTIAKLASAKMPEGENAGKPLEIAGREFLQKDIDAAVQVRKELQDYFKEQFAQGNNIVKDISQESGKVLFTQLLGAGGAKELASAELKVALESIAVSIDVLKISLKELAITFVNDLKPALEKASEFIVGLQRFFENLDPAIRKAIIAFAGLAASIGPLVFIFGQVKLATGVLMGTVLKLVPGLSNLTIGAVASNTAFTKLRHGLTMQGDTIVNTNSKFATLIATLAGGSGMSARFANKFGSITGILKKTATAAAEVQAAIDATTIAGGRALASAGALTPRASLDPAEALNRSNARLAARSARQAGLGLSRVPKVFVPPRGMLARALADAGITSADLRRIRTPEDPSKIFQRERFKAIKESGMTSKEVRTARGVMQGAGGSLISRDARGRFRKASTAEADAFNNLEAARVKAATETARQVNETAAIQRKVESVKRSQTKKIGQRQQASLAAQSKAIASNKAITDADRLARINAVKTRNVATRGRFDDIQRKSPFYAAKGISADARTGRLAFRGRQIEQPLADRIAGGGLRGRMAGAGLSTRIAGARVASSLPGRIAMAPVALPFKGLKSAVAGGKKSVQGFRNSLVAASAAMQTVNNRNTVFGRSAPNIFGKGAVAIRAMVPAILSVNGAFKLMRLALIKTGIGAIIIGVIMIIVIFIQHWDKIKQRAQPVMRALTEAFKTLKRIIVLIMGPFANFFNVLGSGGDDGVGAVSAIGNVFSWLARTITSVSKAVEKFVKEKVVPFLTTALGAVLGFANGVRGLVSAFIGMFKGSDGAMDKLKKSFGDMVTSIIQLFLGTFAPAIIDLMGAVVKTVIKLYLGMAAKMPLVASIILSVFVQIGAGILKIMAGTIIKVLGWFEWIPGAETLMGGIKTAIDFIDSAANSASSAISGLGQTITDSISGPLKSAGESAGAFIDNISSAAKDYLNKFKPDGLDASKNFWGGFGDKSKKEAEDVTEEVAEILVDDYGAAGENAAEAFANKFADTMKSLRQKFVDIVLGVFDTSIKDVVSDLVNALERQREAALDVFEEQLDIISKLEKAEESLMRHKEYMADRRRILDERELNRQNYIRNRALAIYEGRIDDARMFDLEERKSKIDSAKSIGDIDDKRNRDLAQENLDFIKDQIKKTKDEADKFFREQIAAFQEASKEITKFAPQTIEEYEQQLNALTDLAKKTASDNGDAFAATFQKMTEAIQTQLPNIGAGVFTENLQDLVNIAREKYGLDDPSENSIVGATIAMLNGVSSSVTSGGATINASMDEVLQSMKNDVVDKALDEINQIFEDKNPQKVLAEAIAFANETIRREFEATVGHVASQVDTLADSMDPFIGKVVEAQLALEAMEEAARQAAQAAADAAGAAATAAATGVSANLSQLPPGFIPPPDSPYWNMVPEHLRTQQYQPGLKIPTGFSPGMFGVNPPVAVPPVVTPPVVRPPVNPTQRPPIPLVVPPRPVVPVPVRSPGSSATPPNANLSLPPVRPPVTPPAFVRPSPPANRSLDPRRVLYEDRPAWNPATGLTRPVIGPPVIYPPAPVTRQYGGFVPGFGSKSIPALLHGGEYVISSKAVSNIGLAALQSLNNMKFSTPGRYGSQQASTQVTETHNYNIMVENFIGEDQWFQSMMKTYNMKVVPKNQKNAGVQSRSISTYSGINRGM